MLQDELVRAIAGALALEVLKLERERAIQRRVSQPVYTVCINVGCGHRYRNMREDLAQAETLFRPDMAVAASVPLLG